MDVTSISTGTTVKIKKVPEEVMLAALVSGLTEQGLPDAWWERDEEYTGLVVQGMVNRVLDYLSGKRYIIITRKQFTKLSKEVIKRVGLLNETKEVKTAIKRKLKKSPKLMLRNIILNHIFPKYPLDRVVLFSAILDLSGVLAKGLDPIVAAAAIAAATQKSTIKEDKIKAQDTESLNEFIDMSDSLRQLDNATKDTVSSFDLMIGLSKVDPPIIEAAVAASKTDGT